MKRCLNCMELMDDKLTVCPHCGYDEETTDERFDQLKPGTLLKERFTIGRPLGRGGFGITYIAWDNSLQRKVAIKEYLPKGLASREPGNTTVSCDPESKESFLRGVEKTVEESRKLAGFYDLESVVNVYDCFRENGTAYIVMELLRGETVKEKVKRDGSIPFDETLGIITPVLKALAAVHKTGLIHRDISPDNIFICENGKIKLLDFGSARIADNADERSRSIVLKHGYAPKEQYTAKGKQGPFTDIYSACATLYKMLTGITPVECLERIAEEDELQDILELVKIPSPAAKAIMKGMSVNAADRIQSAEELLEKLNEKEDKRASAYYDEEETVTLYVPKPAPAVIPDEPVPASEIVAAGGLNKMVSKSKAKAAPKPVKSGAPKSSGKKVSPEIIKIAVIAAAGIALVTGGIIALPKVLNKEKKTDGVYVSASSTTATTIAHSIEKIITESTTALTAEKESETEKKKETTTETTTEKITIDESKLSTAYIKTEKAGSKVNLRKGPSADSESLGTLKGGDDVKIAGKDGDWYKVIVNGKTGYIKADYITDKKPVAFSKGYIKDGVYYNEWANIKCAPPANWGESTEKVKQASGQSNSDLVYVSSDGKGHSIVIYAKNGSADSLLKEVCDDNGEIKGRSQSVTLNNESYLSFSEKVPVPNDNIFNISTSYIYGRNFYREIDGNTILIYLQTQNDESDLDQMEKYILNYS